MTPPISGARLENTIANACSIGVRQDMIVTEYQVPVIPRSREANRAAAKRTCRDTDMADRDPAWRWAMASTMGLGINGPNHHLLNGHA